MSHPPTWRRVERVRHELRRRELTVQRVERLSPHVVRIVVEGDSLSDFASASFDDHVKLFIDGGGGEKVGRDYTPRAFDRAAKTLTLEFALHGDGPAAEWAARAVAGQPLTVAGPRGSFVIADDHDWHLLVGDETALPAIARRLESLPAQARAIVVGRVADAADRRAFATAARLEIQWVDSDEALLAAVRGLPLPPGEGYAWCAGEARTVASLRQVLVDEKGHPRDAIRAAAYWKRGAVAHHENLGD